MQVYEADLGLRRRTYAFFVEHGRAPVAAELGDPDEVLEGGAVSTPSTPLS